MGKVAGLQLLDILDELYSASADVLPQLLIDRLPKLIGSDITSYNELDDGQARYITDSPSCEALSEVFTEHAPQHPLISYYRRTSDPRAHKLSDFLTRPAFRATAIYQEFFRVVGVDAQLAVTLHVSDDAIVGLAFNRKGKDFSERERNLLDGLRPHLTRMLARARTPAAAKGKRTRAPADLCLIGMRSVEDARMLGRRLGLTRREAEVLAWVAQGKSNAETAQLLQISERTVAKHLERVFTKLGVESRLAAALLLTSVKPGPPP